MTPSELTYHRVYQRLKRRIRVPVQHRPPRVFKPLPLAEQRRGHCLFCGLETSALVCALCVREIEG